MRSGQIQRGISSVTRLGLLVVGLSAVPAFGATNQATGDVAGDATALADSNTIALSSTGNRLTLVKRAFLADGTRVPDGSSLATGSTVKFLLYVSNDSPTEVRDVSFGDELDPAFDYLEPSIRLDTSRSNCAAPACTPAEEGAIFTAADAAPVFSDAVDGDAVSYSAGPTTIDVGDAVLANAQFNVPANKVAAVLLTVSVPSPIGSTANAATGGIAGIDNGTMTGGDGSGTAALSISAADLALTKQARDLAGLVLADGGDVAPGQQIYFVLFVDSASSLPALDLRLADDIDEGQFTYVDDSLETTVVPAGSDDATIWAGPWSALTDVLGAPDDTASAVDTGGAAGRDRITFGAVPGQANSVADIPAGSLIAIRFRVLVD